MKLHFTVAIFWEMEPFNLVPTQQYVGGTLSWKNSKTKSVIFPTVPFRKEGPWTVPNVRYLDDLSRLTCRTSTYLHMRWSTQNVKNAIRNIFRVQIGKIFQELLWWHFCLHQSRTDTLQVEILGFWHKIEAF